ncbi:unnamed protein product, partial [Bubo scandiacus]
VPQPQPIFPMHTLGQPSLGGVWERRLHPVLISGCLQSHPLSLQMPVAAESGSPPVPCHAARQTPLCLCGVLRITSAVSSRDICRRPPMPPPLQPAGHRMHLLPDVSHQPRRGTGGQSGGAT